MKSWFAAIAALFSLHSFATPLSAYIESTEVGQAFLLNRLNTCYAITPAHVVGDGFFGAIVGGLPSAPNGDADVLMSFGYDLALLRVTGGITDHCDEPYGRASSLDSILSSSTEGRLVSVSANGNRSIQPVTLSNSGLIYTYVAPAPGTQALIKGMSGSLLYVDDQPVGILMSVSAETGQGKVLRYDRATETIAPFFDNSEKEKQVHFELQQDSVAASNNNISVTGWSNPPLDSQSRALNLLDSAPENQWFVRPDRFPIDIEFSLSDDKPRIVNRVTLVGKHVEDKSKLPKDFEILVSSSDSGGWISITSGTLFGADETKLVEFIPTNAKRLLLRIYSHWGNAESVGLSQVLIQ